jgi:hypothetical protein
MKGPANEDERMPDEYLDELREAIDAEVADEIDWAAFHRRLNSAIAEHVTNAGASNGYRVPADGGAWWDYAARAALAAVPLALAAGLLLAAFLRSGDVDTAATMPRVALAASTDASPDAARAAFESVLTGVEEPREVIRALIPVPTAAFLADSSGGAR